MSLSLLYAGFLWLRAAARRPGPGVLHWVCSEALEVICGWWGGWGWESLSQPGWCPQGTPQAVQWGLQPCLGDTSFQLPRPWAQVRLPPRLLGKYPVLFSHRAWGW